MKVCDICKNPSKYETYVTTSPKGGGESIDLCGRCYELLYEKENMLKFAAYQQTIEEVTGQPVKKTLAQRLKFWE